MIDAAGIAYVIYVVQWCKLNYRMLIGNHGHTVKWYQFR